MTEDKKIKKNDLPIKFQKKEKEVIDTVVNPIKVLEKNEMVKALEIYGYNPIGYKKAYEALEISRATFYRKLKKYSIQ